MPDRRAFVVALLAPAGCSRTERSPGGGSDDATTRAPSGAAAITAARDEANRRLPRVVMLSFGEQDSISPNGQSATSLLRDRLAQLGRVDGKTIVFEERYAAGDPRLLTRLAREIAESKPDVIVAIAASATAAARQATDTIPIVMTHVGNPVEAGLVASLPQPGGNVTGTTSMAQELGHKQVELFRQLLPALKRLGVLVNPTNVASPRLLANVHEAAGRYGIDVTVAEVTRGDEFDAAFAALRAARPDALFVAIEPVIFINRARVLEFAAANRLPASYDVGQVVVRQGGLMSYGPLLATHYALAAEYVDKILNGARPGDLPVQQPTQFALVINLKTARALGIKVPQELLQRADEVVQ